MPVATSTDLVSDVLDPKLEFKIQNILHVLSILQVILLINY